MGERKEDQGDGSVEERMVSQEDGRVDGHTLEDNNGKESENIEEKEDFKNESEDLWYGEQNEDELMESYSLQQHRRDKSQEYNLFVKTHQTRKHRTSKRSDRGRSSSR